MRFFFCLFASLVPISMCVNAQQALAEDSTSRKTPTLTSTFQGLLKAKVAVHREKVSIEVLRQRRQLAQFALNGHDTTVTIASIGSDNAILMNEKGLQLKTIPELKSLYSGTALVAQAGISPLWIEKPVQDVPVVALGEDTSLRASYVLENRSNKPIDVKVASVSCGCTSAQIGMSHLEPNQSTTLNATMHATDERTTYIKLQIGDTDLPVAIVAMRSKRPFGPFTPPPPVSLFGEKGKKLTAESNFELPVEWQIDRVEVKPSWLQARLEKNQGISKPSYHLTLSASADAPDGPIREHIRLKLKNSPLKYLDLSVRGFISNDVVASPGIVSLGDVGTGVARRTIVVHGPQPFSITGVHGSIPEFRAGVDPRIFAKAHAVELFIPVQGTLGQNFTSQVTINLSDGRELPLDIIGTIAAGQSTNLAQGLTTGQLAPLFTGSDSNGKVVSLNNFRGRSNVILTFFPHCFTGGCESHLSSLRDVVPALAQTKTEIIAVSTDEPNSIGQFANQLRLPFPILADMDREICALYGAVQTRTESPSRMTVLIDSQGIIRYIDINVDVRTHGADMLDKIRELIVGGPQIPGKKQLQN